MRVSDLAPQEQVDSAVLVDHALEHRVSEARLVAQAVAFAVELDDPPPARELANKTWGVITPIA